MQLNSGIQTAGYTLPSINGAALTLGGFPIQRQLMNNWCWSACTVALCQFFGGPVTNQKQVIADVVPGKTVCATSPLIPFCDVMADLAAGFGHYGHLDQSFGSPLTPVDTIGYLHRGTTPIGCQLWLPTLGTGHSVIIYNAFQDANGQLMLNIADPADAALFVISYNLMMSNYRQIGGRWLRSYTTH